MVLNDAENVRVQPAKQGRALKQRFDSAGFTVHSFIFIPQKGISTTFLPHFCERASISHNNRTFDKNQKTSGSMISKSISLLKRMSFFAFICGVVNLRGVFEKDKLEFKIPEIIDIRR